MSELVLAFPLKFDPYYIEPHLKIARNTAHIVIRSTD